MHCSLCAATENTYRRQHTTPSMSTAKWLKQRRAKLRNIPTDIALLRLKYVKVSGAVGITLVVFSV